MRQRIGIAAVIALVGAMPGLARGGQIITTFETYQAVGVSGTPLGARSAFQNLVDPGSLGGYRGVLVTRTTDRGAVTVDINDSIENALSFNSGVNAAGFAEVHFDGNNPSSTINPTGLGMVDLTGGGLNAGFFFKATSDLGATLTFLVYSDASRISTASVTVAADPTFAFQDFFLPFSAFLPESGFSAADFTQVGALSVRIDGRFHPGTDVALGPISVAAVPEPSSLALAGIGAAFGVGALWRRRMRKG